MSNQFKWLEVRTEYREARVSAHGEELRWMVNRETVLNTATGETVTRGVIRHPGTCVIVPFLSDNQILLMRQYRYSIDRELWEVPAGLLEGREENFRVVPTETPEECARRELLEETGYEATRLEKIAECYVTPGNNDGLLHFFFAQSLIRREQSLDVGEVINEIRAFDFSELEGMMTRGEIRDAKTTIALFHVLTRRPSGWRIA
ncbi:MAG TPA: NUDIX hydrolase [Blastocatellia bacterium]|nr:NUDIX hydrolase [Blastocatellia bacterium]